MTLVKLAWRNLGRNKKRSILMIAIVALGTWAIVVLWGVTDGFFKTMIDAQVQLDVASLQIHNEGYLDDPALENGIDQQTLQSLGDHLDALDIEHYSPRINLSGLLKSSYGATGVQLRGFNPNLESQVTELDEALVEGNFLDSNGEIIIGQSLAEALDVRIGERVVVEIQGLDRPASRAFRVVDYVDAGLAAIDDGMAFITLEDAQELTSLEGATEIAISLPRNANVESYKERLRSELNNFTVSDLFDLNPLLRDIIRVNYIELIPIMLVLSLLAGFGVANTVMFTVLERTREFGVMMAVGLRPKLLSRMILLESILASAVGFAVGAGIGYGLIWYLSVYGIDFSMFSDMFREFGMPHVVYAVTSGWYWLYGLSVVVLTALVAAWYPARRATKLDPMEAIRHV